MHLVVGLLRDGYQVGTIDLDARQGTLSGYLTSRHAYAQRHGVELPVPQAASVFRSELDSRADAEAEERAQLEDAIATLSAACEVIVIDCPGADTNLARLAHASADTLITPINDSFVDFAMLARVDPDNHAVISPSTYSEMVWEARKRRFARDRTRIDWIVMRNRMGSTEMRNKRDVGTTLETLAKRIGFRTVKGFGERVIYRELYLQGLTLMDVREAGLQIPARDEPHRGACRGAGAAVGHKETRASCGGGPGANQPRRLRVSQARQGQGLCPWTPLGPWPQTPGLRPYAAGGQGASNTPVAPPNPLL